MYPPEVVKSALCHSAACVIFAQNHPSGAPEPSSTDRELTKRLKNAFGLIDVRVLVHFVIGGIN
nr:JAB domain-containing protein [Nevskia ramosa]